VLILKHSKQRKYARLLERPSQARPRKARNELEEARESPAESERISALLIKEISEITTMFAKQLKRNKMAHHFPPNERYL
jgi:hypothetical protein